MADPHTLKPGCVVTHPEWPAGSTRRVIQLYPFQRATRDARGRQKLVDDPNERVAVLDLPIEGDDGWMEAGLVEVKLFCTNHPDRASRTNLDGDELCQECADAWVRGEGEHAAYLGALAQQGEKT